MGGWGKGSRVFAGGHILLDCLGAAPPNGAQRPFWKATIMPAILTTLQALYLGASARTIHNGITIVSGRDAPYRAPIQTNGGTAIRHSPTGVFASSAGQSISFNNFLGFLRWVDESPADHRNIIFNQMWRQFYEVTPRIWPTSHGGPIMEDSVGCWHCGIILPIRAIQVDHSRPQAAHVTEAVAKVFRHAGLTVGAPGGMKGQMISGRDQDMASVADRYTLTVEGAIVYSLIHAGTQHEIHSLRGSCVNNISNLRPMCGRCNTARNIGGIPNKF